MKSHRKRYTSYVLMLCLAVLVGMLSGCASDNDGSNTESLNIYEYGLQMSVLHPHQETRQQRNFR